jgi:hypothetical protein
MITCSVAGIMVVPSDEIVEVLNLSRKSTRNSWQKIYYESIMDKDRVGFLHSRASLHHLPKDLRMSESPSTLRT